MERKVSFGLLIAAVVVGTLVLVLSAQPEEVRIASEDGLATLIGSAIEPERFAISRRDDMAGPYSFVICPVYEITPGDAQLSNFAKLSITCDSMEESMSYALAHFDVVTNGWQTESIRNERTGQTLKADIAALGLWTIIRAPEVDYQGADELLLRQLVAEPPSGAVGYGAVLGISTVPGDFFVEGVYNVGGCDGRFANGTRQMTTSLERQAFVTIDGEQQVATVRMQMGWQLDGGCPAGEKLE